MELGFGRAPYAKFQPMKVMLLTLQEDPPSADIYKDDTYKFSKNFHSMISKCLRKDPKKRPSAKKLLEHKFFKVAEDNNYIFQHLVRRIPENRLNGTDLSASERPHICKEKTIIDAAKTEKSKPVSVGSWIFDKGKFKQVSSRMS
jgi:serine/threonine-protein kinase OSR1/STK39